MRLDSPPTLLDANKIIVIVRNAGKILKKSQTYRANQSIQTGDPEQCCKAVTPLVRSITGETVKVAHMIIIPIISASVIAIDCRLISVDASISKKYSQRWRRVERGQNLPEVRFGGMGQFEVRMSYFGPSCCLIFNLSA